MAQVKAPPPAVRTFVEKARLALALIFRDFGVEGGRPETFLDFVATAGLGFARDRVELVELYRSRIAELSTPTPLEVSRGTVLLGSEGPGIADLQDQGLSGSPFAGKDRAE